MREIVKKLDFIKANDWPAKGESLNNNNPKKIPFLWALCYAPSPDEIVINYDIHPTKCFPCRYMKNNGNSSTFQINIKNEYKQGKEVTLGGCGGIVHVNEREYIIFEENPKYCSIFGIPDDCYDPQFENRMKQCLKQFQDLTCWCFKKSDYVEEQIKNILNLKYMKSEFLPTKHYIHTDPAGKFLKAIFVDSKIKNLNRVTFYPSGKELIEDMDYENDGFRYEEEAIFFIKKRLIFEFIREMLLLQNKDKFSAFDIDGSKLKHKKNDAIKEEITKIIEKVEIKTNSYICNLINEIKSNQVLDEDKLKRSRFLVVDIEYLPFTYPTDRRGAFNFPCIFSNILWEGMRKRFTSKINLFLLPCHICKKNCKEIKKNTLKFDCINNSKEFIKKQVSMMEELLIEYDGFKIYTYGKSDIHQLEQTDYFFSESDEFSRYERKNRKRLRRLVDITDDLEFEGKKLKEIEIEILEKWLKGWSRKSDHFNKNARFVTRYGSISWEKNILRSFPLVLMMLYRLYCY